MRGFFYEGIDVSTKTFFDETVQRGRRTGLVRGRVWGGGERGRGGSKEVAGQTCGSRWPGFELFPSLMTWVSFIGGGPWDRHCDSSN